MDMTFKPLVLSNSVLHCCQVRPVHTDVVCHSLTTYNYFLLFLGDFYWFLFLNSNSNLKTPRGIYRTVPLPLRRSINGTWPSVARHAHLWRPKSPPQATLATPQNDKLQEENDERRLVAATRKGWSKQLHSICGLPNFKQMKCGGTKQPL
jgi:hypothetical protein